MDDAPNNVQIRIEGHEWRYHGIGRAQNLYDCNRSDAIANACADVARLVEGIEDVLNRDDLTRQQRREIAETLSTSALEFSIRFEILRDAKP